VPESEDELLLLLAEDEYLVTHHEDKDADLPPLCSCHNQAVGSCPDNISATINLVKAVVNSGTANRDGVQCPVGNLNVPVWEEKLRSYNDKEDVLAGNKYGWELGTQDTPIPVSTFRNHSSSNQYSDSVDHYINTELRYGTLCGPLPDDSGLDLIVSPIGTVPKPGSDKRRVIVDSSFPEGHSINASIPKNIYRGRYIKVKLPTVPDLVEAIRRVKKKYPHRKVLGHKVDFSRYYRYLPTCPRDWRKQCIQWKGKLYLDKYWSFGLRSAVQAAQRDSDAVNFMYKQQEGEDLEMYNYIDDFIGIDVDFRANTQWQQLQKLVEELGFNLSQTKGHLVSPSECFRALGIEFNIPLNLVRIPEDKLMAGMQLILKWENKLEATKVEIQELLGLLNHFSGCIRKGRLFVSRMLTDLRAAYKAVPHRVTLSQGFRQDLQWWKQCMVNHNGFSILDHRKMGPIVTMDASKQGEVGGLPGIAAYNFHLHQYFHRPVPDHLLGLNIADYELMVILICARVWGNSWRGLEIEGFTDNENALHLLRNGRSESNFRLHLAREFWFLETMFDFSWKPQYIASKDNHHSDSLSRWGDPKQQEKFYELTKDDNATEITIDDSYFLFDQNI